MAARKTAAEPVQDVAAEVQQDVAAEAPVKKAPATVKAKVLITFKDKHTGELHAAGDVIEVTGKRLKEINTNKAFVKKI